jgi:hypothetical protein
MAFDPNRKLLPCRVSTSLNTGEFDRLAAERAKLNVGINAVARLAIQRYLGLPETAVKEAIEFRDQFKTLLRP